MELPIRSSYGEPPRNDYNAPDPGPASWMGSLMEGSRDFSGLMYRRNRYLDPTSGQFTQPDPIGLAGGLNLYGYANGDPVTYNDPYGLTSQCIPGRSKLCPIVLAAITVVAATPIDEAVVGTISTAALPVAAVGAFALLIGPEYLRDPAEITPMTPATAVAQQDATMYANAGKGRGDNRVPNSDVRRLYREHSLNERGQEWVHDQISKKTLLM